MTDMLLYLLSLIGGLSLVFFVLGLVSDYALPALMRKPWRTHRRPAATRRAR